MSDSQTEARLQRRGWKRALKIGAAVLAIFMFFKWFEHQQVYHPSKSFAVDISEVNGKGRSVHFNTEDGLKLNAWLLPAPESRASSRVVLLSHGNGGNVSHRASLYSLFYQRGLDVFAYDYRGYGRSEGWPSEQGTYQDAAAAWRWLTENGYKPEQIIAWGESLGGAVAAELALRKPVAALVLQSAFTSIPDIGAELFPWLPVKWIASIQYDTREKIARATCPVFILHSREDSLIRFHHAERNFESCESHHELHEVSGDHNDPPHWNAKGYLRAIKQLTAKLDESSESTPSKDD